MMIARSALLRMVLMSGALAVFTVAVDSPRASAQASGPRPVLLVTDGSDGSRLVLRGGAREVGSIAVPPGVGRAPLDAAIASALWHPNGRDVAIGLNGDKESFLGPNRTYPVRRTRAVEWLADRELGGTYAGWGGGTDPVPNRGMGRGRHALLRGR